MQTFLPYPSFGSSAYALDRQRLGKQRVEAKQIVMALDDPNNCWNSHPAVKMWRGHRNSLTLYGSAMCSEWQTRGYKDTLLRWFYRAYDDRAHDDPPWWVGYPPFHLAHRKILLAKDPDHYSEYFHRNLKPAVRLENGSWPYFWPTKHKDPT